MPKETMGARELLAYVEELEDLVTAFRAEIKALQQDLAAHQLLVKTFIQAADEVKRKSFKAGFFALIDPSSGWTFDGEGTIAADKEQEAWEAYERHCTR